MADIEEKLERAIDNFVIYASTKEAYWEARRKLINNLMRIFKEQKL